MSESATLLYAREAAKVTKFNGNLKNKTAITSFNEFEYFVSYRCTNESGEVFGVFTGCSNLESIKFPSTFTGRIGYVSSGIGNANRGFFYHCTSLMIVDFNGSTPTEFGACAFIGCTALVTLNIPSSVTIYGNQCLQGCTALVTAEPSYATTIYGNAFNGCTKLVINNPFVNDVRIGAGAFRGCSSLTSLTFNGDCTIYDEYTFAGCTSLVSFIVQGEFLLENTDIAPRLFQGNTNLTTISPLKVTSLCTSLSYAFYGCASLQSISFDADSDFSNFQGLNSTFYGCSSLNDVSFLSSIDFSKVTGVSSMFYGCTSLTSLAFPSNADLSKVTTMASMFYGCTALTSVAFPSNADFSKVTDVSSMFYGCTALTSIPQSFLGSLTHVTDASSFINNTGVVELGNVSLPNLVNSGTPSASGAYNLFRNNSKLTKIGNIDLSNYQYKSGNSMSSTYMFYDCTKLVEIGNIDLSSYAGGIGTTNMFARTTKLQKIGVIICPLATSCSLQQQYSGLASLTDFGGFRGCKCNINCSAATKLTRQSALNVINECGDNSEGSTTYTITFAAATKALLTDADIALATAKGYTIA